jgi:hypothetical protein
MGMLFSNSGYVGVPVLLPWLGAPAAVAIALTMIVKNLLMLPLVLTLADRDGARRASAAAVLRDTATTLLRYPLVLAIAAGVAVAALVRGVAGAAAACRRSDGAGLGRGRCGQARAASAGGGCAGVVAARRKPAAAQRGDRAGRHADARHLPGAGAKARPRRLLRGSAAGDDRGLVLTLSAPLWWLSQHNQWRIIQPFSERQIDTTIHTLLMNANR